MGNAKRQSYEGAGVMEMGKDIIFDKKGKEMEGAQIGRSKNEKKINSEISVGDHIPLLLKLEEGVRECTVIGIDEDGRVDIRIRLHREGNPLEQIRTLKLAQDELQDGRQKAQIVQRGERMLEGLYTLVERETGTKEPISAEAKTTIRHLTMEAMIHGEGIGEDFLETIQRHLEIERVIGRLKQEWKRDTSLDLFKKRAQSFGYKGINETGFAAILQMHADTLLEEAKKEALLHSEKSIETIINTLLEKEDHEYKKTRALESNASPKELKDALHLSIFKERQSVRVTLRKSLRSTTKLVQTWKERLTKGLPLEERMELIDQIEEHIQLAAEQIRQLDPIINPETAHVQIETAVGMETKAIPVSEGTGSIEHLRASD